MSPSSLIGSLGTNSGAQPAPGSETYNPQLIALGGQSNACGSGLVADLVAPYTDLIGVQAGLTIYNPKAQKWEPLNPGVNTRGSTGVNADGTPEDPLGIGYLGIESRLLKSLRTFYGLDMYITKYAMSNTNLAAKASVLDWSSSSNELLTASNANHTAAMRKSGDKRPPKCYVWLQGENDANATDASSYATNLTNFISAIRTFYGYTIPFIICRMSTNQTAYGIYVATIQAAQDSVAAGGTSIYTINTNALVTFPDNIHYTYASLDALAILVYNKIITL